MELPGIEIMQILCQSVELTPENLSIFSILVFIIGYLIRENEKIKKQINELQNQRLEDQKKIFELSISLVQTIEKIDGFNGGK